MADGPPLGKCMMTVKREDETQIEYLIRIIRSEHLDKVRSIVQEERLPYEADSIDRAYNQGISDVLRAIDAAERDGII